jgi:hypothetical protein
VAKNDVDLTQNMRAGPNRERTPASKFKEAKELRSVNGFTDLAHALGFTFMITELRKHGHDLVLAIDE